MTREKIGTLRATWPFKVKAYVVDGEIKSKVPNTAAMHSGRFWWMKIQIERQHFNSSYRDHMLHHEHEHKHAIDKSHFLRLLWGKKALEVSAEAHANAMKGKAVPWIEVVG